MEYFIIAIVVGVVGFIVWASIGGDKLLKERTQKLKNSEPAKAKILGFKSAGFRGRGAQGEFQAYKFSLEVSNAYKSPYNSETIWNVFAMGTPKVQEGCEVKVRIDASDPMVIYPDEEAIEYSWSAAIIERAHRGKI